MLCIYAPESSPVGGGGYIELITKTRIFFKVAFSSVPLNNLGMLVRHVFLTEFVTLTNDVQELTPPTPECYCQPYVGVTTSEPTDQTSPLNELLYNKPKQLFTVPVCIGHNFLLEHMCWRRTYNLCVWCAKG